MKERPILFSAQMVRAILDGRKTQTRRVVKPQGAILTDSMARGFGVQPPPVQNSAVIPCPYGQPGDRLWVRETWQGPLLDSEEHEAQFREDGPDAFKKPGFCAYRATDTLNAVDSDGKYLGWRPSIHMPRWASRIQLEVVSVRVERLYDISPDDCIAEGAWRTEDRELGRGHEAIDAYRALWESINGPGSWEANPLVWVIEFKRVKGGAA